MALSICSSLFVMALPAKAGPTKSPEPIVRKPPTAPPASKLIEILKQSDLQFGRLIMIGTSGSVHLPATGLPSYQMMVPAGGSPRPARFEIRGPANHMVDIQLTFPLSGGFGQRGEARLDTLSVVPDHSKSFQQTGTLV